MTDRDSDQRQAERLQQRVEALEGVLQRLSSWVGAGGLDAAHVDPEQFEERIRWGVNFMLSTEERRRQELQAQIENYKAYQQHEKSLAHDQWFMQNNEQRQEIEFLKGRIQGLEAEHMEACRILDGTIDQLTENLVEKDETIAQLRRALDGNHL